MILIRRINITILLEGEAEGKSSNHFRKSFMDMLKRAICYLWLTLLTVFSILGSQLKEPGDYRLLSLISFCK